MTNEKREKLMEEYAKRWGMDIADVKKACEQDLASDAEDMTIAEYKKLYEDIVAMSVDADGFGLFYSIRDRDVEKCKWIAAIMDVLDDVPRARVEHIFEIEEIADFDSAAFVEENYEK